MGRVSDLVIIPDVHGRQFWKGCVDGLTCEDVVFLGDYLDSYSDFGISPRQTVDNFKEIIEYKKSRPDNVTLLLGNHDFGRYIYRKMCSCRTDRDNLLEISELFETNRRLFKVGHYETIGDVTYTFTHAALMKGWVDMFSNHFLNCDDPKSVIDTVNELYAKNSMQALPAMLDCCSRYRGGWSWYGSVVWADVCEMDQNTPEWPNTFEVFAHTRLVSPALCKTFLCCDCGSGFRMKPDGTFTDMSGVPIKLHDAQ